MNFSYKLNEISATAQKLICKIDQRTVCLHGLMGAGKTTLVKEMVKKLGAIDVANSPTFGIVNEYHRQDGELLAYHFDFYRLKSEEEALDMGLEEYLSQDVWIFMEWPEKITSFLPLERSDIFIEILDIDQRKLTIPSNL